MPPSDVEVSFYPYQIEVPSFEGLNPGMSLHAENADPFVEIIDPELFKHIKEGWFQMRVGETTSFDPHPNYVAATREGMGKVSLGDQVGQIHGYVAGRPFPEQPRRSDPRAGEKLAWNFRFAYRGDGASICPLYSKYRDVRKNKIERTLKVNHHVLNLKHRVTHAPIPDIMPNPSNLFYATYNIVLEPYDVKNT